MTFLGNLVHHFQDELERNRNRPFLRGVMAACALVATADGKVTFGERIRVDQILEALEALKVFDPHEGVNLFNEFAEAILEHPKQGHAQALQALQEAAIDAASKALIIRVCCGVSEFNEVDGRKILADQIEIVSLCTLLGVEPAACGLYTDGTPTDLLDP